MSDRIPLGAAARLLGVSRVSVYRMVERGELHRRRGPFGWEYSRREVERLARIRTEMFGPGGTAMSRAGIRGKRLRERLAQKQGA
jgi:hypothetical protein